MSFFLLSISGLLVGVGFGEGVEAGEERGRRGKEGRGEWREGSEAGSAFSSNGMEDFSGFDG